MVKKLKASGGIIVAHRCVVKTDLESGDIIGLGENTGVEGNVHAESSIKLSEGVGIYGLVDAGGASMS